MSHCEIFSTTADVGIRIRGHGYDGLYHSALKGLNLLLFAEKAAGIRAKNASLHKYEYQGDSAENILVNLLSEILFLLQCRGKITADMRILEAAENFINVELKLIEADMEAEVEIKSVTYHNLKVVAKKGGKYAEILFDI
jgi:CRISPR-associated protein Cas8b1/Cst1 subtype I-B